MDIKRRIFVKIAISVVSFVVLYWASLEVQYIALNTDIHPFWSKVVWMAAFSVATVFLCVEKRIRGPVAVLIVCLYGNTIWFVHADIMSAPGVPYLRLVENLVYASIGWAVWASVKRITGKRH